MGNSGKSNGKFEEKHFLIAFAQIFPLLLPKFPIGFARIFHCFFLKFGQSSESDGIYLFRANIMEVLGNFTNWLIIFKIIITLQQNRFPPRNNIPWVFGARVDVYFFNLIMHHKPTLGIRRTGGSPLPHWCPIRFPPPLVLKSYTFGGFLEPELM